MLVKAIDVTLLVLGVIKINHVIVSRASLKLLTERGAGSFCWGLEAYQPHRAMKSPLLGMASSWKEVLISLPTAAQGGRGGWGVTLVHTHFRMGHRSVFGFL